MICQQWAYNLIVIVIPYVFYRFIIHVHCKKKTHDTNSKRWGKWPKYVQNMLESYVMKCDTEIGAIAYLCGICFNNQNIYDQLIPERMNK